MKLSRQTLLALVLTPAICAAQSTPVIVADRPTFSDGPAIVAKGHWDLEVGYTNTRVSGVKTETFGELNFRYPLSDRMELRIINGTYSRTTGGPIGLNDPSIGFRYRLQFGDAHKPDLAIGVSTTVPAGQTDLRVRRSQPTVKFIYAQSLDALTGVGANVIASDLGPSESRFTQYALSAYVTRALNPLTSVFAEVYRLMPNFAGGPDANFGDVGITYIYKSRTQFDFRIGSGFNQSRDGSFFGFGVAYLF